LLHMLDITNIPKRNFLFLHCPFVYILPNVSPGKSGL
jgi:hypothetical protein